MLKTLKTTKSTRLEKGRIKVGNNGRDKLNGKSEFDGIDKVSNNKIRNNKVGDNKIDNNEIGDNKVDDNKVLEKKIYYKIFKSKKIVIFWAFLLSKLG